MGSAGSSSLGGFGRKEAQEKCEGTFMASIKGFGRGAG